MAAELEDSSCSGNDEAHQSDVSTIRWNPWQMHPIPDKDGARPGQALTLDDACWLAQCGKRHIKFWTLLEGPDPTLLP